MLKLLDAQTISEEKDMEKKETLEQICATCRDKIISDYIKSHNIIVQKQGKWNKVSETSYVCSACNNWSCCNAPYCPECGAKMENS